MSARAARSRRAPSAWPDHSPSPGSQPKRPCRPTGQAERGSDADDRERGSDADDRERGSDAEDRDGAEGESPGEDPSQDRDGTEGESSEEEASQDMFADDVPVQPNRAAARTKKDARVAQKTYAPCTLNVQVGKKESPEVKLIQEWLTEDEPNFDELQRSVIREANRIANADDKYDSSKEGALYYRERNAKGRRSGKGMTHLDSQTTLAVACSEAHRSKKSRQKQDPGALHFTVKFDALPGPSPRTSGRGAGRGRGGRGAGRSRGGRAAGSEGFGEQDDEDDDKDDEPKRITIIASLRGSVFISSETGAYCTAIEDGSVGIKTFGQPKSVSIDLNPKTQTQSVYTELEDLAYTMVQALPDTRVAAGGLGASHLSLKSRYDNVKVTGMLFACVNTRGAPVALINSSQARDDFLAKKADATGKIPVFLSVGAKHSCDLAVQRNDDDWINGGEVGSTDTSQHSQGATSKNLPPTLVSKEQRTASAIMRKDRGQKVMKWENFHRTRFTDPAALRFKEPHITAISEGQPWRSAAACCCCCLLPAAVPLPAAACCPAACCPAA
jgi:hypothetical protein